MLEWVKLRALLIGWAKWKRGGDLGKHDYLSPPNLIYRLMMGDVLGGGGFGSVEPRGLASAAADKHNAVYHRLDCVIDELPPRRRQTIQCEFLSDGRQQDKAAAMGISLKGYERNLNFAIKQILADDFIQNLVQAA
ncbi:hypothetical protein [Conchiformibius steedae]|uniref:Uncharacterized protein n=1 Tax=Conchiformibius steedae TaxID=153493 RepID=A0A3P2A6B9_9NEIS|nr:hypothetical protein [Conchiformibius steedae]RRD90416.1 hypothetical protein EII21_05725 [Conchiformibius steedae]